MLKTLTTLYFLLLISGTKIFGQTPGVWFLKNPLGTNQDLPMAKPTPDGGFIVAHPVKKSSPDSTFASITKLNSALDPVWNRTLKMKANLSVASLLVRADGSVEVVANANDILTRFYPLLLRFSSEGQLLEDNEIVDSSSTSRSSPWIRQLFLQNGSRIIIGPQGVLRMNTAGKIDFQKQLTFQSTATKILDFQNANVIAGTNQWIASGRIGNTGLCFFLRMNDTTMTNFHVYDLTMSNFSTTFFRQHLFENQESIIGVQDNGKRQHIARLSATGEIIWWKSYKIPNNMNPTHLRVDNAGDIWMTGSITPGQAGGIVVHYNSIGSYVGLKGQSSGGTSLGNISVFEPLPSGEFFSLQRGYYAPNSVLYLNKMNTGLNYLCFDSPLQPLRDSSYTIIDSTTTLLSFNPKRFGITNDLSFPLKIYAPVFEKGVVDCAPTSVEENKTLERYELVPNPATTQLEIKGLKQVTKVNIMNAEGRLMYSGFTSNIISTQHLLPGLYQVELPAHKKRLRFIKE